MSKKRKTLPTAETKIEAAKVTSFKAFFAGCVIRGKLKPWQEQEIHAFFKDLGLKDKESSEIYKDALAKY
jgi:hypothetical protein